MKVELYESGLKTKKFTVKILGEKVKTVNFGAKGYEDFTTHKDPKRKERYLLRHAAKEDWKDFRTAGFWSRWLLWNKETLAESIADIESRFDLEIVKK